MTSGGDAGPALFSRRRGGAKPSIPIPEERGVTEFSGVPRKASESAALNRSRAGSPDVAASRFEAPVAQEHLDLHHRRLRFVGVSRAGALEGVYGETLPGTDSERVEPSRENRSYLVRGHTADAVFSLRRVKGGKRAGCWIPARRSSCVYLSSASATLTSSSRTSGSFERFAPRRTRNRRRSEVWTSFRSSRPGSLARSARE